MKLAIAQMVFGVLILTDYFYRLYVGRFAGVWTRTIFGDGECLFGFLLGLAVLGCGIAQYLKAREARIRHEATP